MLQLTYALGQQSIFKTYTVSDGLVNNDIRKIFQDSKGFLWIATWEGLSKYDGNHFTNFTEKNGLSHNLVNDIIEAPDGDIYVSMNNGCVDVISHDKVKHKALFQNVIINQFYIEHNKLLALTDNAGIIEINSDKIKQLIPANELSFFNRTNLNDSLIIASSVRSPFLIYDKNYVPRIYSAPIAASTSSNYVYHDAQQRLWMGTTAGLKLLKFSAEQKKVDIIDPPAPFNIDELRNADVTSIFQQSNGSLWFATSQGLINISADGKIVKLKEKEGLPSRSVTCIFEDKEHSLWIGTEQGLSKILSNSPVPIPGPSLSPPGYSVIINKISERECLLLTNGQLYRYNFSTGKTATTGPVKNENGFVYIKNSFPFQFIQGDEILQYEEHENKILPILKLKKDAMTMSAATPDQKTFFLGTLNGMLIARQGQLIADPSFPMRIDVVLVAKNGDVWIGAWDRGLYKAKFDAKKNCLVNIFHLTQLPDEHIRSLAEDEQGNIWVGTRFNGVLRLTETSKNQFNILSFNQQKGLTSNWIRDIAFDDKGNVWLATMSGIDKLVRKNNDYVVFNYSNVINLTTITGLVSYFGNKKLLCSTLNGVFLITDDEFEKRKPVAVRLTKIAAGKEEINEALSNEKILLPYSDNHASFEFTTPSYLNEKLILYSYRLKGSVDTSWSVPSDNHSVQFASLEPGHYSFEVRMLGWNGNYGPITSFNFSIAHPYWKSWWFYSLIGLAILLLTFLLYRYRINQLLRVQKVRNNIATDLHDDIGSTLTNIGILSELSKKNLEQAPVAEKYLERITEESLASQQALDDIIWSVNSRNDNLRELEARMRRYIAEVFESSNIVCHFNFESETDGGRLNMEQRRDLYLVFKECMNNIYKHAGAKNISVSILVKNGVLSMNINDDGKGFDPGMITDRNGLKNLKTRVEKWKGILKIHTVAGKGSDIQISMPVK